MRQSVEKAKEEQEDMVRCNIFSPSSRMIIPVTILPNGSFRLTNKKIVLLHEDGRLRMINLDMNIDGSFLSRGDIIIQNDAVIYHF